MWIYSAPDDEEKEKVLGIIGQELEPILPYAIKKTPTDVFFKGGPETEIIEINLQAIVYVLVNACKELSAEVDRLKEKIDGH